MPKVKKESPKELKTFLQIAIQAALEAGDYLCRRLNRVSRIDYKGVVNLVTEADRHSQKIILAHLRRAFPDHGFLAEEDENQFTGKSDYRWLIDPLDGTTNFAHGLPIFCISLALERQGDVLLGVVYDPIRKELFRAIKGQGAWLNNHRIQVSRTRSLNQSLLATGFPYDLRESQENNLVHFENFLFRAQAIRRCGAAALDLAYVACGRFDGFWELKLKPWDIAAGSLLVSEAGGRVSDFQGKKLNLASGEIVATNGLIHDSMIQVLALGSKSR